MLKLIKLKLLMNCRFLFLVFFALDEKLVGSGDGILGTTLNSPLSRSELRTEITKFLRDTTLIPDRTLAYEVYLVIRLAKLNSLLNKKSISKALFLKVFLFLQCTVHDDNYGPLPDAIKR